MEVFSGSRSRNAVIKRMIEIRLIANRSEILQKNRRKNKSAGLNFEDFDDGTNDHEVDSHDDNEDDDDEDTNLDKRPVKIIDRRKTSSKNKVPKRAEKPKPRKCGLNVLEVRKCMKELTDDLRENIEWICESLNDAAEDAEDCSEDPDDGVPLVPFSSTQRDALEVETFQKLLLALGMETPAQNMVIFSFFLYRTFDVWPKKLTVREIPKQNARALVLTTHPNLCNISRQPIGDCPQA